MFNLNSTSPSTRSPAIPSKYTDVDIGDYYDESVGEADFLPSVPSSPLCSLFPGGAMDSYPEPLSAPLPAYDAGRPKSISNKRASVNYADNTHLTSPSVWSRPLASPKFKKQPIQRNSYANTASKLMATMAEEEEESRDEQRRYMENFKFPAQQKAQPLLQTSSSLSTSPSAHRSPVRSDVVTLNNPKKKYDKNNKPQLSLTLPKSQNEKRLNGNLNKGVEECAPRAAAAAAAAKCGTIRWKWVIAILFILAIILFAAGFTKWILTNSSPDNSTTINSSPPKHAMAIEKSS